MLKGVPKPLTCHIDGGLGAEPPLSWSGFIHSGFFFRKLWLFYFTSQESLKKKALAVYMPYNSQARILLR